MTNLVLVLAFYFASCVGLGYLDAQSIGVTSNSKRIGPTLLIILATGGVLWTVMR